MGHQRQPMYGFNQQKHHPTQPMAQSIHSQSPSPNISVNSKHSNPSQQPPFNITNSIEHQQCIQFLKSRNFSHNASPQQREEILNKINNALSNKYTHNELQRRIQILRQCAAHILQTTKPPQTQ